jgi:hypothetical protein
MLRLVQVIDQALGYVPPSTSSSELPPGTDPSLAHAHHHSHQKTPALSHSNLYHTSTVQEKWVDHADVYADFERKGWEQEGRIAIERANADSARDAGATRSIPQDDDEMEGVEGGSS